MSTKDLTARFLEIRSRLPRSKKAFQDDSVTNPIHGDIENAPYLKVPTKETLPPSWLSAKNTFKDCVQEIEGKMKELKILQKRRLDVATKFTEDHDEYVLDKKIEDKGDEIMRSLKKAHTVVEKISEVKIAIRIPMDKQPGDSIEVETSGGILEARIPKDAVPGGLMYVPAPKSSETTNKIVKNKFETEEEARLRSNMQKSLATHLQKLSTDARKIQTDYMTKISKMQDKDDIDLFIKSVNEDVDQGERDVGFTQKQKFKVNKYEALVKDRDQEIVKIAKSIEELAHMFRDLATMVADQGTVLDRIDFNLEKAVENTKDGIEELEEAKKNQENAMSRRCVLALVVCIVIMIILLLVKSTGGMGDTSATTNNSN